MKENQRDVKSHMYMFKEKNRYSTFLNTSIQTNHSCQSAHAGDVNSGPLMMHAMQPPSFQQHKLAVQPESFQLTSMRPGPYKVAAATASLLLKVWPAPLTKAAMVKPFAKPDSNGKLAAKEDFPASVLTWEIGTVTGRFAPER